LDSFCRTDYYSGAISFRIKRCENMRIICHLKTVHANRFFSIPKSSVQQYSSLTNVELFYLIKIIGKFGSHVEKLISSVSILISCSFFSRIRVR